MNIGVVVAILFGLLVTIIKWGLIIWGIVWLVRYLKRGSEEQQRLRMELGKLAEEVSLIRKELKEGKVSNSPGKSG
jgi:Flp pilus assembly protein TadB